MSSILIVPLSINQVFELQQISTQTFCETFAAVNSQQNIDDYLKEELSIEKLSTQLLNPLSVFYAAMSGDSIIGYLKLNFGASQTEIQDENAMEIERIYVLKSYQDKRIGKLLFSHALQIAQDKNLNYVWLGVWEKNEKAINFYTKQGFNPFDQHVFKLGADMQVDILMKLELIS